MVYLISPFIEKGVKSLNKKEIQYILITMTMIEVLCIPLQTNWGSSFFGLLYIYMIGRYMRLYNIKLRQKQSTIIYTGTTLLLICVLELMNITPLNKKLLFEALQYNNPLIVLQAIGLFFIFANLKPHYNNRVNRLFRPCLCIYLITESITPYKYMIKRFEDNIFFGIILTFATIIGCLFIGHIVFFATNKISNLISNILTKRLMPIETK